MSHTKTAAVVGTVEPLVVAQPALITFSLVKATLFDIVSMRSIYMTKNIKNAEGKIIGEDFAMTGDDLGAFETCLGVVMSEIFEIFLKHTTGIANSYLIDTTNLSIKILDHSAYNENLLSLVDLSINDCIIDGCLFGWFTIVSQSELMGISGVSYAKQKEALKSRLFQLKIRRAHPVVVPAVQ